MKLSQKKFERQKHPFLVADGDWTFCAVVDSSLKDECFWLTYLDNSLLAHDSADQSRHVGTLCN